MSVIRNLYRQLTTYFENPIYCTFWVIIFSSVPFWIILNYYLLNNSWIVSHYFRLNSLTIDDFFDTNVWVLYPIYTSYVFFYFVKTSLFHAPEILYLYIYRFLAACVNESLIFFNPTAYALEIERLTASLNIMDERTNKLYTQIIITVQDKSLYEYYVLQHDLKQHIFSVLEITPDWYDIINFPFYIYKQIMLAFTDTYDSSIWNVSWYMPYYEDNITYTEAWFVRFGILFLLTTLCNLIGLSYLGLYGTFITNIVPLFLFWANSLLFLNKVFFEKKTYFIDLGKWFIFNLNNKVNFELYIDYISISFIVLTLTIALFVYIYCFSYFRAEPNVERLMLFINLFVISMIILVSSGNFVVLFLGWELIGLTSFFLINFWSTRMATLKAAFKAFSFNKFSDVCVLFSTLLAYMLIGDFNLITFNNEISSYINFYINVLGTNVSYIEVMSFFLLSAAFIKSAQFGTHIWLPDSMEAPVPASALIHSATLVSAGVFLLLRFSPLFELSAYAYYCVLLIGSFTAFFGGISAAYQSDIKRILAYSTISHCGFLMVCFCTASVEYTLLYLYIHGFFKAAVFLCVGNVIRFSKNYQDFRRMGGLYKILPFECYISLLCLINLSGLPFTLGFYIKHLLVLGLPDFVTWFVFLNVIGGALSGIVYSYRLYYYVFFDFKKARKAVYKAYNARILVSEYYSNTTLASNLAISGLMISAYLISVHYFNININTIFYKNEISHFSFTSANMSEFFYPTLSLLKNVGYVNWLILLTILLVFVVKWRYSYSYPQSLKLYWLIFNFSVYFYMFTILIC